MTPLLILFSLVATSAQAGWDSRINPIDSDFKPGSASIRYIEGDEYGHTTFHGAFNELQEAGNLDLLEMIIMHGQVVKPTFQSEIIKALEEHAPREFAEAMESAGNMHNPKLVPLNGVLDEIVLLTPTVVKIDAQLAQVGLGVVRASHEKLMLLRVEGELVIAFFLYLIVAES